MKKIISLLLALLLLQSFFGVFINNVSADITTAKADLELQSRGGEYISKIDTVVNRMTKTQLQNILGKIKNLPDTTRSEAGYKEVLNYLEQKIELTLFEKHTDNVSVNTTDEETVNATEKKGEYKEYDGTIPPNSILFFHATWSPTSVMLDKNFSAEEKLNVDTDIIKIDFDSSSELKEKYGILRNSDFVLVDEEGNLVRKIFRGRVINKDGDLMREALDIRKSADLQQIFDETIDVTIKSGEYKEYDGTIPRNSILFFYASSDRRSSVLDRNFNTEVYLDIGIDIIKIDYDSFPEIREKYGDIESSDFVLIDEEGNLARKISGPFLTDKNGDFIKEVSYIRHSVHLQQIFDETPNFLENTGEYKEYDGTIPPNSILFFYVGWSASSISLDIKFKEDNKLQIDTDIIKIDYDSSSELREIYGIPEYGAFVLVDDKGNLVRKISGTDMTDKDGNLIDSTAYIRDSSDLQQFFE